MIRKKSSAGFSLIELLLVVAIMGIISGIAIPAFISQRRRARLIGDAQANCQVLRMQMESYKADSGVYGPAGAVFTWAASGAVPASGTAGAAYNFIPKGNSKMNFTASLPAAGNGLLYTITVVDPTLGHSGATIYTTNQSGSGVIAKY